MSNTNEVFVKTENIKDKLQQEKIRERLEQQRERRKLLEKYRNIKGLADDDDDDRNDHGKRRKDNKDDDEDAAEWYERTKRKHMEKIASNKSPSKRHKTDKFNNSKSTTDKQYKSDDLKGLAIGHKSDSIKEGERLILTLRDKNVLDDEQEDVLENVNLVDNERVEKNLLNKKKRPEYRPYDDDEFETDDIDLSSYLPNQSKLLGKYDEEIDGPKNYMFRIGSSTATDNRGNNLSAFKNESSGDSSKISLNWNEHKIASEYYTAEEMELKFKKPKSKKKLKNIRNNLKKSLADELPPIPTEVVDVPKPKRSRKDTRSSNTEENKKIQLNIDEINDDNDDLIGPDEDLSSIVIEDETENELQSVLQKARKIKLKEKLEDPAVKVVEMVKEYKSSIDDNDDSKDNQITDDHLNDDGSRIIINATAEFCRNLGEYSMAGSSTSHDRQQMMIDDDDDMDGKVPENDDQKPIRIIKTESMDGEEGSNDSDDIKFPNNWNEVDMKNEDSDDSDDDDNGRRSNRHDDSKDDDRLKLQPILEEEPDVSKGIAGALKLAMTKGYLDKETPKSFGATRTTSLLQAQSYTIEEKFYDDDRLSNSRHRDRYSGSIQEFREKEGYKPDFKLDYVDEKGCVMNQKEAFRYLSHKFHGKGPGKNKIDKRMKKLEQESKLRQMSSTDTPLNTVKLLQEKHKELQKPYIVLSGGNKQQQQQSAQQQKIKK